MTSVLFTTGFEVVLLYTAPHIGHSLIPSGTRLPHTLHFAIFYSPFINLHFQTKHPQILHLGIIVTKDFLTTYNEPLKTFF